MLVGHRRALDPTPSQERELWSHAGAARVAFNWGLARVQANIHQRAAVADQTGTLISQGMSAA